MDQPRWQLARDVRAQTAAKTQQGCSQRFTDSWHTSNIPLFINVLNILILIYCIILQNHITVQCPALWGSTPHFLLRARSSFQQLGRYTVTVLPATTFAFKAYDQGPCNKIQRKPSKSQQSGHVHQCFTGQNHVICGRSG